VITHHYSC